MTFLLELQKGETSNDNKRKKGIKMKSKNT